MADIAIFISSMASGDGVLIVSGEARCTGMEQGADTISWYASVGYGDLAATANAAIKTAAVAAANLAGFTVGPLDKKTLYGAAVEL